MKTNRPTFRSDEYADDSPDISAQKPFKGSDPYRHVAVAYSPGEEVIPIGVRVGRNQLEKYNEELSTRDREILASLKKCKFLLTGQIQRLHITNASTQKAARRAAARELRKLKDYGLVNTLERRIGGTRAGSGSLIWHLTEAGERFLAIGSSEQYSRRRYLEPSRMFLRHSLAVSECYVQLVEICRRTPGLTLLTADWEPDCWRPYTQHGKIVSLKPDLFVATKSDGYEDRWFIEIDLSTESPSTIIGKCDRYRDYYRSGLEQKQFGVFPVVVWLVLDAGRKERLRSAIQEAYPKGGKLFIVITADEFERLIRQGFYAKDLC